MMNKLLNRFYNYSQFGPPINSTKPEPTVIKQFEDKLPTRLLNYWSEFGFCGWGNGIFWTVDPNDYSEILKLWLQGTEFEKRENDGIDKYHVIGRSAFGRLFIWGEKSGNSLKIDPLYGMLFPTDSYEEFSSRGGDTTVDLYFATKKKNEMDEKDVEGSLLFDKASEKLGLLEPDEMYAFVPALALGGTNKLENLKKVKVIEHLNFLADLGEKRVMADIVAMSNELHKK